MLFVTTATRVVHYQSYGDGYLRSLSRVIVANVPFLVVPMQHEL
jgi:hypothetical protein